MDISELDALHRNLLCEEKASSLRREIAQLRKLFIDMKRRREPFECISKDPHNAKDMEMDSLRKQLDMTQTCLRHTQTEAAAILDTQHLEMESLQKERDEALADLKNMKEDAKLLTSYNAFLEHRICSWIDAIRSQYLLAERKTEEIAEIRGRTNVELEWVRKTAMDLNLHLTELHKGNSQLALFKEEVSRELHHITGHFNLRIDQEASDAQARSTDATKEIAELRSIILELKERIKKADQNAEYAVERLEAANMQVQFSNNIINKLLDRVSTLEFVTQNINAQCLYENEQLDVTQQNKSLIQVPRLKVRISVSDRDFTIQKDYQNLDPVMKNMEERIGANSITEAPAARYLGDSESDSFF